MRASSACRRSKTRAPWDRARPRRHRPCRSSSLLHELRELLHAAGDEHARRVGRRALDGLGYLGEVHAAFDEEDDRLLLGLGELLDRGAVPLPRLRADRFLDGPRPPRLGLYLEGSGARAARGLAAVVHEHVEEDPPEVEDEGSLAPRSERLQMGERLEEGFLNGIFRIEGGATVYPAQSHAAKPGETALGEGLPGGWIAALGAPEERGGGAESSPVRVHGEGTDGTCICTGGG